MTDSDIRAQAAENMCTSLMEVCLMNMRTLPKPWQQMPKKQQDEVIDSLRSSIREAVETAARLIASNDQLTVVGTLEQITIKDGVKAQVIIKKDEPNFLELVNAVSKEVLIVCANNAVYDKDFDDIEGEDDQRALDLGHEYKDQ